MSTPESFPTELAGQQGTMPPPAQGHGSVWSTVTGIVTTLTALCALAISFMTLRETREEQLASRYAGAIENLSGEHPDTRVGAIFALARIANESTSDRPVIVELLSYYVRARIGFATIGGVEKCGGKQPAPTMDVVVALQVLTSHIHQPFGGAHIDLSETCLRGVDLPDADFTCAKMDSVIIAGGANLADALFRGTSLQNATLSNAVFTGADFSRATLTASHIDASAAVTGTSFNRSNLSGADLSRVDFTEADFRQSRLTGAELKGATFDNARLDTYLDDAQHPPTPAPGDRVLTTPPPDPPDMCG